MKYFLKVFRTHTYIEFYSYICPLAAVLQAEFHELRSFFFFYTKVLHAAACSWIIFLELLKTEYRNSHRRCSLRKGGVLEISQNSQENTYSRASFLIKLEVWHLQIYLKRDSGKGVFLWILWHFQEHIYYRKPPDDCFREYPVRTIFINSAWTACMIV